jgi:hypothetical protein
MFAKLLPTMLLVMLFFMSLSFIHCCLELATARFLPRQEGMNVLSLPTRLSLLFSLLIMALHLGAQPLTPTERLINQYLQSYAFTPENAFRLATYLELKGHYHPAHKAMSVDFGGLGSLTFYQHNCLLRAGRHGVYTLDQRGARVAEIKAINEALAALFEQIFLMGSTGLDPKMVRFVERNLARKNLGAFDKILLRHLLVRFGRYDSLYQRIELRTEWLPDLEYDYRAPGDRAAYQKPKTPLYIKLDRHVLRGFYLRTHGTVYVEDVKRELLYATGEEQAPNVTAFKALAQQLFTQNTLYLVQAEQKRLATLEIKSKLPLDFEAGELPILATDDSRLPQPAQHGPLPPGYRQRPQTSAEPHRYHPYHWVPMMLGLLRNQDINVADPEVLPYFLDEPYFDFLYRLLTPEEKREVDRQIQP